MSLPLASNPPSLVFTRPLLCPPLLLPCFGLEPGSSESRVRSALARRRRAEAVIFFLSSGRYSSASASCVLGVVASRLVDFGLCVCFGCCSASLRASAAPQRSWKRAASASGASDVRRGARMSAAVAAQGEQNPLCSCPAPLRSREGAAPTPQRRRGVAATRAAGRRAAGAPVAARCRLEAETGRRAAVKRGLAPRTGRGAAAAPPSRARGASSDVETGRDPRPQACEPKCADVFKTYLACADRIEQKGSGARPCLLVRRLRSRPRRRRSSRASSAAAPRRRRGTIAAAPRHRRSGAAAPSRRRRGIVAAAPRRRRLPRTIRLAATRIGPPPSAGDCEAWYFDWLKCIDKCAMPHIMQKLK